MNDPILPALMPNARFRRHLAATALPLSERQAIHAGVRAGDTALARSGPFGVLTLFMDVRRSHTAAPRLKALRAYAELRRVMLPSGHEIPPTCLVAAGFTAAEIADIDTMIAAIPSGTGSACSTSGLAEVGR
ncbi:hypothetical protein HNO88_002052 [Novosphingobium chloroacetimidivorans]|uniref:Uncharacterized protein n=1 Tax=Novosphingobium chloroacetimidivorans TaxID=1428314 RepID=A0A7W7NVW9_9SPHN|nr:hypothetical protein [Novosphingobium chloroacetimidivorans]MBB4858726.1 hypothetical protein [Novosphingobium chloroacetimidivorans]